MKERLCFGEAMKASWLVRFLLPGVLGLVVLIGSLCGCDYVLHKLAPAGRGKWIPAQSEALSEGKKVLILVYADENIQYQHGQMARYYTAAAVAEQMQSKLKVVVVDPLIVEKYQASDMSWADIHPSRLGYEKYQADLTLYVELQEFTTAAEDYGELLRGRMEGNCSLFTADQYGSQAELLWQKRVNAVYPPDTPQVAQSGAAERIRAKTVKVFAENLVKNFHGHREAN
jgi:hypothetical protein